MTDAEREAKIRDDHSKVIFPSEQIGFLLRRLDEVRAALADLDKPICKNPCAVCGGPILARDGTMVGMGDGSMRDGGQFAHRVCYEMAEVKNLTALVRQYARHKATCQVSCNIGPCDCGFAFERGLPSAGP